MNEPAHIRGILQWQDTTEEARRISAKLHPSRKWQPLKKLQEHQLASCVWEQWQNDICDVTVRRYAEGSSFDEDGPYVQIGICWADGSARHDWRDFQAIKNQVVGDEWEAIELYPAESRLVDPSNYFMLWAYPKIPIGLFHGRRVESPRSCNAPQRGWAKGTEPAGLR